jgi:hypothetical protein
MYKCTSLAPKEKLIPTCHIDTITPSFNPRGEYALLFRANKGFSLIGDNFRIIQKAP